MNRFWVFVIGLVTLFLSWLAYFKVVDWFSIPDPISVATILAISIFIHELGHYVVIESYGVKCFMFFAVLIGGVGPQKSYVSKYKDFGWDKLAKISLAGVIGNLIAVVTGGLLYLLGHVSADDLNRIADINAGLIMWNLLPVGFLDGGKFARMFFDSSPEHLDGQYFKKMTIAVVTTIIVITIITFKPFFLFAVLFVNGLMKRANEDDEEGSRSKKAMTKKQLCIWGTVYIALIMVSIAISGFTKPWIR